MNFLLRVFVVPCFCGVLILGACHRPPAGAGTAGSDVVVLSWTELSEPRGAAVLKPGLALVAHLLRTSDGSQTEGVVSRMKGTQAELLFRGLKDPRGIVIDERRGTLLVVESDAVEIFKLKKPSLPPVIVPIPVRGRLGQIAFSLMNRRAYVTDVVAGDIWALDPKKGSVERAFDGTRFLAAGWGGPEWILASTDGTRLYVTTSEGALVEISLRKADMKLLRRSPGAKLVGLDIYRHDLLTWNADARALEATRLPGGEPELLNVQVPGGADPAAFVMDLQFAVFVPKDLSSAASGLPRVALTIK